MDSYESPSVKFGLQHFKDGGAIIVLPGENSSTISIPLDRIAKLTLAAMLERDDDASPENLLAKKTQQAHDRMRAAMGVSDRGRMKVV